MPAPPPIAKPSCRRWPAFRRFLTHWVAEEPDPVYSWLDIRDGRGRVDMTAGVVEPSRPR
jgi:hypothetical protein